VGQDEKESGRRSPSQGVADELWLWKQECPDRSLDAFIFPNSEGGFMDTGNYRNRILAPLAEKMGLPKLNFQVLRRTMALWHSETDREGYSGASAARESRYHYK